MSVLLIILVVYVICLFLLHLFLFLRYKYKEMMRERLKAEMLAANPDIYGSDSRLHSRAGSTTSINTGEVGAGLGQSLVELLPNVSSDDHHGGSSGTLANSSSHDDGITSLANTPASLLPVDDAPQ